MASSGFKSIVATLLLTGVFSLPLAAPSGAQEAAQTPPGQAEEGDVTSRLLADLQAATPAQSERIADQLRREWSRSGSASADLLLKRGRDALDAGEVAAATEHFTALIDHAPDFAEGYVGRAMAYYQLDLLGPAVADLERALTLNPVQFDAITGLGAIFEQLEQPELAYRAYEEVLMLHPGNTEVQEAMERLDAAVRGREL